MGTMNEYMDSLFHVIPSSHRPASHTLTWYFVTTPESWKDKEMLNMRKLTCRQANGLEKPRIRS